MTQTDVNADLRAAVRRAEFVRGLRDIADWFEAHPEWIEHKPGGIDVSLFFYGDEAKGQMLNLARALGSADKAIVGSFYEMARRFGPHKISANTTRENVCERVVTTEEVTEKVPDPDLVAEIPMVTVTHTVEKVEWVCPESLLAEVQS